MTEPEWLDKELVLAIHQAVADASSGCIGVHAGITREQLAAATPRRLLEREGRCRTEAGRREAV